MKTAEQLRRAHYEARNAHNKLEDERDRKITELVSAFERETKARLTEEYAARLLELATVEHQARLAAEDAALEETKTKELTVPLGTVMLQWDRPRFSHSTPFKPTGKRGVLEVISRESVHPSNRAGRAQIGDVVIRIVTKEGKPGLSYVMGNKWGWHPEGVDPNKEEKAS